MGAFFGIRPLVGVPGRDGPEAAVELRGERAPRVVAVLRAAEERTEAQIDGFGELSGRFQKTV